jgi:hypothetical protein
MSDLSTIQLIDSYLEESPPVSFLSGFFRSPPGNFHTTQDVELDIQRDSEDVAIVIADLSVAPRHNESTLFVNKRWTPPIFEEQGAISSFDMMKRQFGEHSFMSPDYAANATRLAFSIYRKCEMKIRRAIELMAAQVLQTGKLILINKDGVPLYEIDFGARASHFVNAVGGVWAVNGSTGDPLGSLAALATVIRRDSKRNPNTLIFGDSAYARFIANTTVRAALDNRRMDLGLIQPQARGQGATYMGSIWVGAYNFEMYTSVGDFNHPQTGVSTPFIDPNKVIMLSNSARLEMTWGAIPRIVAPDPRALPFLPPRISSVGGGIDLTTNAWITPDGKHVMVSAGTRPLTVPVAVDAFGTINTSVAA